MVAFRCAATVGVKAREHRIAGGCDDWIDPGKEVERLNVSPTLYEVSLNFFFLLC